MKVPRFSDRKLRITSSLFAAFAILAFLPDIGARAQDPPVPAAFQDLYGSLNTDLTNFNATLNPAQDPRYPVIFGGNLTNANANVGPQLINAGVMSGIQLQLQELQAIGVKAVVVQVCFPILYEPFITSQGQSYAQFVSFYQQVAASVRAAGLKLIVENDTLLTSNNVSAGWDIESFYASLDWNSYQQARAQNAAVVAQTMHPDYLVVLEEPDTEAANSGQWNVNTAGGATAMLGQIVTSLQQAGVPDVKIGAGVGTWLNGYLGFIQGFVTLPLDFIDMHVYPVNNNFLPNALQIASTAAAAGKPVAMSEGWLSKVRDNELGNLTANQTRGRDPFSFWSPVDAYFLQTMVNLANHTQMAFMAPMGSQYLAAYLPYDSTQNLTPSQILSQVSGQASQNMQQATFSNTAKGYYATLVTPPDTIPPSIPTGLAGGSTNPTTAYLAWNPSADNVGEAGYNVRRNGAIVGATATLYYQDAGLTESTTYSYSVEAFDLGGNISAPSARINITTKDVTPPNPPANLTATPATCQGIKLNWSPSTDNLGVASYIVFWGLSPNALVQAGRTGATSFTSYPLTAGTTYYYGVQAVDNGGNTSLMSTIVQATTPQLPTTPAGLIATAGSATRIALAWNASASGGLPVQYYHVFRGSTAANLIQLANAGQNSYTDTSLTPGTKYYYAVQAVDTGADLSDMSVAVATTTPALPSAPTNLVVTPSSASRVGLTWSPAASGGLPIQNYRVFRGSTANNLTQIVVVTQTLYWDSTVTSGATYYYAIVAADTAADLSPMSAAVSVKVPTAPTAPTGLVATPLSTTKVSLTWNAAVSGGLPIQNYRVFRGATATSLSQIATVLQTSYTDSSGSSGNSYYYAVQAADTGADLSPISLAVRVTTMALPSAPINLKATAPSKYLVTLTWTVPQSGMPLVSYSLYRGKAPSALTSLRVMAAPQTGAKDNTVAPNTTYYYSLQAKDTGGNLSPMSATVAVTTPR